jgi:hypothetical protein
MFNVLGRQPGAYNSGNHFRADVVREDVGGTPLANASGKQLKRPADVGRHSPSSEKVDPTGGWTRSGAKSKGPYARGSQAGVPEGARPYLWPVNWGYLFLLVAYNFAGCRVDQVHLLASEATDGLVLVGVTAVEFCPTLHVIASIRTALKECNHRDSISRH